MARPTRYSHGYASVTGITGIAGGAGLQYWYGKYGIAHCEKIKKTSQNIGHGVHKGIELFHRGRPFSECIEGMDNDQKVMLSYLVKWSTEKKLKVIAMEEPLYYHCKVHHPQSCKPECTLRCPKDCEEKNKCFAGTPDVIGTLNGGKSLLVVDWKTDKKPKDRAGERERMAKYYWQLSGYAIAYERTYGVKVNKGYVVRASKELELADYFFPNLTEGKREFKQLREIYARLKGK